MRVLLLLSVAGFVTGCASKVEVYDSAGKLLDGVPVRSPVLAEVVTETTYEMDPTVTAGHSDYRRIVEACKATSKGEVKVLPLGAVHYINYKAAWFGKSEFKVEYNDNGGLKSVQVNSDPAATTEGASKLLETVLPFLGKPQVTAAALDPMEALRARYCIVKSTTVKTIKERRVEAP